MQATIYVTKEAMATASAIKDMDYHTRVSVSDDDGTDMSKSAGYYLKNAGMLKLAQLPDSADIALCLRAEYPQNGPGEVSMPTNLRGCIFEHAPNLPERYAEIVTYWSGEPLNLDDYRAAYFQNPQNEYLVELRPTVNDGEFQCSERLLSEGVVVSIVGIGSVTATLQPDDYIVIVLPIDADMLGIEPEGIRSLQPYRLDESWRCEHIYLKVSDIMCSPDPDHILIDILRYELLDYGYWY